MPLTKKQKLKKMMEMRRKTTTTASPGNTDTTTSSHAAITTNRAEPSRNITPASATPSPSCPSRSKSKLEISTTVNIEQAKLQADMGRTFLLVDEDNLLKWIRSVAGCVCGNKITVREDHIESMAKFFVAKCGQCNTIEKMCTSQGGVKSQ